MVKTQELWHSTQQLKGSNPNFIYKGKRELTPTKDMEEREEVLTKIDDVVLHPTGQVSNSHSGIIYFKISQGNKSNLGNLFVVKTVPTELDNWNRFSPILSYGIFPDKQQLVDDEKNLDDWIEIAVKEIKTFAIIIHRTLTSEKKLSCFTR